MPSASDELQPTRVSNDQAQAFVRAEGVAFGQTGEPEGAEDYYASLLIPDLAEFGLAVSDAGRMVATASAIRFELTLPAGPDQKFPAITVPGVTAVGVHPTHRRRGLLSKLMSRQLADFRDAGFPLSILLASESVIYGRFGYGLASSWQSISIDSHRDAFRQPPPGDGFVRLLDPADAGKVLPGIHDQARRLRPGEVSRQPQWWDHHFKDPEKDRHGGGGRFYAVHESAAGDPDGYVSYRYHYNWDKGIPSHRVDVSECFTLDDGAYAALWRFVLDLDLVGEVTATIRPMDDPLRWLLADPRHRRVTAVGDFLWVRVLDVPAALSARGYGASDQLVLDVRDAGLFALDTGPESGSCRAASRGKKVDFSLTLADLGAIYLGGVKPSTLAAAGRITEERTGALGRADAAFASPVAPFCSTDF
jgi:predicted acetyltransferase